jgi:hypothetical protein
VFIAYNRLGDCYFSLIEPIGEKDTEDEKIRKINNEKNCYEKAIFTWLMGYERIPQRGETLYKVINKLRLKGKNQLCALFLKTALKLDYPNDMMLFVEHNVYAYKFIEELSIIGYYAGLFNQARAACEYCILYKDIPGDLRHSARNNSYYYIGKMNWSSHRKLVDRHFEEYIPSSSCLFPVSNQNGFVEGIVRTVNYSISKQFVYTMRDPNSVVRTKNYWAIINTNSIHDSKFYEITNDITPKRITHISGLEDLRMVEVLGGKKYGMAVDWENGKHNHPSVVITHFEKDSDGKYFISKIVPTMYKEDECQKNWVPFSMYGRLYAIYSHHPLTILEIEPESGVCDVVIQKYSQYNLEHIRGSSIPIQLSDGSWLIVVHEVMQLDTRKYVHRLLKYDKDWNLLDVTYPFYFQNLFVEFCLSLYVVENSLSIVFSTEDNTTEMVTIDIDKIDWLPRDIKKWIKENV